MPVLSGLQLMTHIKQQKLGLTTVAISAYADQNIINTALNAGFDHYLTKPIDAQTLKKLITQVNTAHV